MLTVKANVHFIPSVLYIVHTWINAVYDSQAFITLAWKKLNQPKNQEMMYVQNEEEAKKH